MTVALRPGRLTNLVTTPPSRSAPTDTGTCFAVGISEKGDPTAPRLIQSMSDYSLYYGQRVANGLLYDFAETFFREGGTSLYLMRVVGPAPVIATLNLKDTGGSINAVTVNAKNAGAWGLALKIQVIAGVAPSSSVIQVWDTTGLILLDQSPDLLTHADAVLWGTVSNYVSIVDLGTGVAQLGVLTQTALTGSATGDESNATETQWTNALNLIPPSLGPGQVCMPGRTTATAYTNLLAHAKANNRHAVLDAADTATVSTITTASITARASLNGQYGEMFAPWLTIVGLTPGTVRVIPPSALICGLFARSDANNDPDTAAAGDNGIANTVVGVDFTYTDAQRDTLNTAGVNVIRQMLGGVRNYGIRTLTDPVSNSNWIQGPAARLIMAIIARANNVMEAHMFNKIDGRGIEFASLGGDLSAVCAQYYQSNALFGATPADAYLVNVGASVNTPTTIAAGELHAQISLRVSPAAELVVLDLIKVPTNQNL